MTIKQQRIWLEQQNKLYPEYLRELPLESWPQRGPENLSRVLRSSKFLVQVFTEKSGLRLSVNRCRIKPGTDQWDDDVSWEDLQNIKRECGYGERFAIEILPADSEVVNVANMRHIWVLEQPLQIGWKR